MKIIKLSRANLRDLLINGECETKNFKIICVDETIVPYGISPVHRMYKTLAALKNMDVLNAEIYKIV